MNPTNAAEIHIVMIALYRTDARIAWLLQALAPKMTNAAKATIATWVLAPLALLPKPLALPMTSAVKSTFATGIAFPVSLKARFVTTTINVARDLIA